MICLESRVIVKDRKWYVMEFLQKLYLTIIKSMNILYYAISIVYESERDLL